MHYCRPEADHYHDYCSRQRHLQDPHRSRNKHEDDEGLHRNELSATTQTLDGPPSATLPSLIFSASSLPVEPAGIFLTSFAATFGLGCGRDICAARSGVMQDHASSSGRSDETSRYYLTCLFIPFAQTKSRQCGVSQTERIALPFLRFINDALCNHFVNNLRLARVVKLFPSTVECLAHNSRGIVVKGRPHLSKKRQD